MKLSEIFTLQQLDEFTPSRDYRGNAPVEMDRTPVRQRGDILGTIWWRGRQWAVTSDGVEALDGTYFIAKDRLTENMKHAWPAHVTQKTWVDREDFCTAWLVALAMHGTCVSGAVVRNAIAGSYP